MIKFEIGGCYKNSNGDRVEIISILQEDAEDVQYPIIGWVFMKDCIPSVQTFTLDGRFLSYNSKDERDLVGKWEEPPFRITELGEYLCRDGVKVYVTNILPKGYAQSVKGYRADDRGQETWDLDGSFLLEDEESVVDIVEKL